MSLIERDSVLTSDEAIKYLRISKPTFFKLIRAERIKAIKAGKGYRILQSELNRFLMEGQGFEKSNWNMLHEWVHTQRSGYLKFMLRPSGLAELIYSIKHTLISIN